MQLSARNAYVTRTVVHAIIVLFEKVKRKVDRIREIAKAILVVVNQTLVDFLISFGLELNVENGELTG
jgi:hypothetical protein